MRAAILLIIGCLCAAAAEPVCLTGVIEDSSGAAVAGARVEARTPQGAALVGQSTSKTGAFALCGLPAGSYILLISCAGFATTEIPARVAATPSAPVRVALRIASPRSAITVSASRGAVDDVASADQVATVAGRDQVLAGAPVNLGSALQGQPGILVQETTYGQVSPYLRGLTGYQTLLLIDGIRFNTSTFRSGPNQYLGFIQPSQVERVEAILGPAGATYGSDAMGGTVQVITLSPRFSAARNYELHGELKGSAGSADASAGGDGEISIGNQGVWLLFGYSRRRINDLRAGGGEDSRNAFHRYFGLSQPQVREMLGSRLVGTGLTQDGALGKLAWRPSEKQSLILWYQWSDLGDVRSYRDQLGGPGRLQARVEPQVLNFAYARFERLGIGRLDSVSGTFSLNSQRDGTVRQALRTTDVVTTDYSRVDSYGYSGQAATHAGSRLALVFGGEIYDERILSTRFSRNPVSGTTVQDRALFPNGSRYITAAGFVQSTIELAPGLRAILGARYTNVKFTTSAESNRDATGRLLGVSDTHRNFRDLTFNASLAWRVRGGWSISALVGRGFRAPNLTDLGAVGVMTALGFDIPAEDVIGTGALIGSDSGDGALSTGRAVRSLRPESLDNYEIGVRYAGRRLYGRIHVFDAELMNPITARTVLFPVDQVPSQLVGLPLTQIVQSAGQREQGVVAVATPLSSRAVKASVNDGHTRYYGVESVFSCSFSSRWSGHANYTFLVGRDLNPNRPVRRLPPQVGRAELRYVPGGRRPWVGLSLRVAGEQSRMGGGDLDDDRMGASRRRSDIGDFFRGGTAAPWIAEGLFLPSGETLRQIQDRVLPLGSTINGVTVAGDGTRIPLYTVTSGWYAVDVHGGMPLSERTQLQFGIGNLFDRNYRVHGSGIDAPGINLSVGFRYTF
jgi:outer membrane receptor protein involved in Fe transport